jgi:three-Cys-motif partner protein
MVKEIKDYLKDYTFSDEAKPIINSSSTFNEEGFGVWSFKKLIFLEYYIYPFLLIALNQLNCKCFFIDLFSSSGANKCEEITSLGSPIISLLKGIRPNKKRKRNDRFCKWFFIEQDKILFDALKIRTEKAIQMLNSKYNETLILGTDIRLFCGDCNEKIDTVLEEIKTEVKDDKACILAFIDPYNFKNIKWETWKKLSSLKYIDIIFTFPIQSIERGSWACKDLNLYLPPSLVDLLNKTDDISKIPEEEFEKKYAEELVNLVNRSITSYKVGISVKSLVNREIYRITLMSHSKKAVKICSNMAKKLDKLKTEDLKTILDSATNRQKTLF